MRNLLEFILLHLVKHPEDVVVEEFENEDGSFEYVIRVHQEDVGRVIGRQGSTIQAIRTLSKVRAMQDNIRVRITLDSDDMPPAQPVEETVESEESSEEDVVINNA